MTIRPTATATLESAGDVAALRHRVDGEVLTPGDPGYKDAALAWNRTVTQAPDVIVVAENVGDVVATVKFAASSGCGLGVQATGHGVARPVDGVLLVTSRLHEVAVDPEERTAWVGAGCTWGQVVAATQAYGLVPLAGSSPSVGAVGSTIGGGLGWLARHYGPTCDSVRSFEVVTADGSLVRACQCENVELFRALRGGGGGGGVITDMELELVPLTSVYAGNLSYPTEAAAEVVARFARWVTDAPVELTSSVVLSNVPSSTIIRGCWSGPVDAGRALLDEWRALMPPVVDAWTAMPFDEFATISQDPVDPMPIVATGGWLDDVDAEVGAVLAAATFGADGASGMLFSEIRHLGGAVATGTRELSTMGNRDKAFLLHLVGTPTAPAGVQALQAHQRATKSALGGQLSDRTYLNFLDGDERRRAAPTAIDAADRGAIAAMSRRLDPDRLLRFGVDHTG